MKHFCDQTKKLRQAGRQLCVRTSGCEVNMFLTNYNHLSHFEFEAHQLFVLLLQLLTSRYLLLLFHPVPETVIRNVTGTMR